MNGIKVFALLAVLGLASAQFSFNPLAATDFAALALAPLLINQALTPVGPPPPFPGGFGGRFPGAGFPGAFPRPFLPPPTISKFRSIVLN